MLSGEHRGWMIRIYRVGRRHEYQAIAEDLSGAIPLYQGPRFGGPGAMTRSHYDAKCWVETSIARGDRAFFGS